MFCASSPSPWRPRPPLLSLGIQATLLADWHQSVDQTKLPSIANNCCSSSDRLLGSQPRRILFWSKTFLQLRLTRRQQQIFDEGFPSTERASGFCKSISTRSIFRRNVCVPNIRCYAPFWPSTPPTSPFPSIILPRMRQLTWTRTRFVTTQHFAWVELQRPSEHHKSATSSLAASVNSSLYCCTSLPEKLFRRCHLHNIKLKEYKVRFAPSPEPCP